ncbi:transposase [Luteibacter sp.]|uniref:REP-associated tyrosine transposase n=1 Tax=Luteibacter sp. TaxID=1886636 RepID=UPI0025C6CDE6|nr:transposase [Luteibacter sp.]
MSWKRGHASLRHGRVSEPGRVYVITCVTWNRAPVFRDYRAARIASRLIHAPTTWKGAECLAWVVMPDHIHVMVKLGDRELSRVVASLRSRLTRTFKTQGRTSPLWQRAFHDRALRTDENLRAVARYIVANPLRAGLVNHIGDYPYWNAIWL